MEKPVVRLNRSIIVEPKMFDENLENRLKELLAEKIVGSCDYKDGIILSVENILNYSHKFWNATSEYIFFINFEGKTLKPVIGDVFMMKIKKIFPAGVFGTIEGSIDVFVPSGNLKGGVLEENDEVLIEIVNVRYEKGKFDCIGRIN